ncbi:MarR family winged helix-turn-helix transcriptional regulator [Shimwellia blattae]|uniref:Transcriptional regulator n=1 Tax=Shimwellia blattae (strain ATCC 29907 / DSM 4481 / JCM 1650 / NBRC 105725 / CDC 9005-74) TaxID=630626 RepID=I2BBE9_SHIBC|nr:MarR family winged helix-turn-helix transcriptional regulator [Shimwellia blattae]AFJ47853.1 transcriptional regulator [Shimwellia blattae DSM 4481 = NBRC 105725]GAB79576.1 putative MarR family transcriptional regulator [Shimwellia blattae DSM 4481 = NBRC 105725]VDY65352.1 homoprotocatechuate degradation operon regulator, HpaR [Shimwellia blattae]VEC24316.1 homoprotocatechuate degradation operon regulator, HpaR [Shimwellia blattae]
MTGSPSFINGYLPALLGQAWLVVSSEFHSVVESRGLSVLEWRVLSVLEGNGPTSVSELALKTVSKQPTITRLLHRLEHQKQVERCPDNGGDRRLSRVRVTVTGKKLVQELNAEAARFETSVLAQLGEERSQMLKATLCTLIERYGPG